MNLKFKSELHLRCEGEGPATLLFDAGMGNWSLFFEPLYKELKKAAKVCIVDRKGYADFKKPDTSRDTKVLAAELNEILISNNINDPIILVGHSLGGLIARMYHSLYPEKVIGMVLLDAAHPQLWEKIPQIKANIEA